MKILLTTDQYTYNIGGVTTAVLALSAGLKERGHEVKVLTVSENGQSHKDGDVYYVKSMPFPLYPGIRMSFSMHDPLVEELTKWKPDVIHVQSELSTYHMAKRIIKQDGSALIMTCHTDYSYYAFGRFRNFPPIYAFMKAYGKHIYGKSTSITVPSEKATNFSHLAALKDRLTVIPNGIELEKCQKVLSDEERESIRKSLGIGPNDKIISTISRVSKEKNVSEIISCIPAIHKRLPETKLMIVGDGPYRKHLEKQVERLGLKDCVVFTGRIPHEDVWKYYALSDIYASASIFEVHSMSYLEALAQGVPLICRRDDALKGVLEEGRNGLIYDTRKEFAKYAYQLLTDDERRTKMGQESLKIAQRFSNAAFAASMIDLYESVFDGKKE